MNNLIVNEERLTEFLHTTVNTLNNFIEELGLSSNIRILVTSDEERLTQVLEEHVNRYKRQIEKDIERLEEYTKSFQERVGTYNTDKGEINTEKERRKRRGSGIFAVEKTPYISDVNEMLLNGTTYRDISEFLKSKGLNISKASIGRYAQKFFDNIESNNPPMKGGAF